MARILKKLASAHRRHALKRNTSISLMHGLPAAGRLTPSKPAQQPVKVNDEKSTSLCPPRVADHSRGNFCSDCRVRASARILNAPFCRKRCRANSVYGQKAIESQHGGNSPHSFLGFCHLRTPTHLSIGARTADRRTRHGPGRGRHLQSLPPRYQPSACKSTKSRCARQITAQKQ
jgi:hypothetical protein